jgi:thiamine biosynthesis lipoprotein
LLLAGCAGPPSVVRETEIFGTRVKITVNGLPEARAAAVIAEVFTYFGSIHRRFHAWREGELLAVNRAIATQNLPFTLSEPMAVMLVQAADYSERSSGLFNPAAGRLFALWGFHSDKPPTAPPPPSSVKQYLANAPSMAAVNIQAQQLRIAHPLTQFDFGALAKGVALDAARDMLHHHGVRDALINIGGNILAMGANNGRPWRVRIQPATDAGAVGTINLADGEAIATSGGGERFFIHDGRRYHHVIDPRSGMPAKRNRVATVISAHQQHAGAISDAAATALLIANDEEAAVLLRRFKIKAALRVSADNQLLPTAMMQMRLAL